MESGIENGDVRLGRHDRLARLDARDVRRLMQRSERHELLDALHRLLRHQHGLFERLAAVQHAVTAGTDFIQRRDGAVVLVRQRGKDGGNSFGVVLHVAGKLNHLVGAEYGLLEVRTFDADALDQTLRLDGLVVHVDELELQGRRASVDDQNLHGSISSLFDNKRGCRAALPSQSLCDSSPQRGEPRSADFRLPSCLSLWER